MGDAQNISNPIHHAKPQICRRVFDGLLVDSSGRSSLEPDQGFPVNHPRRIKHDIQMDLLQFIGFVLAWSLALITVSTWVTSWVVKVYGFQLEAKHEIQTLKEKADKNAEEGERLKIEVNEKLSSDMQDRERLMNELNKVKGEQSSLSEQIGPAAEENRQLAEENSRLKELNRKLEGLLTKESRDLLY